MMKIFGRIITTVSGQTIRDVMRYSRIKVGPDMMEFVLKEIFSCLDYFVADTRSYYDRLCHKDTAKGAFRCLELCLYGIRELA